jgi:hypothetical protein
MAVEEKFTRWTLRDWNDALVKAVFHDDARLDIPIRTIQTTSQFFSSLTPQSTTSGETLKEAFIRLYSGKEASAYRAYFNPDLYFGWKYESKSAPFFGHLFLSLLVAAADEDTYDEGNFRQRFSTLLNVPPGQVYFGPGLAELWRRLEKWSHTNWESGKNCRRLILPDPGNETIIGFPKRLAFPTYRDQTRLAGAMASNNLDAESPVESIIEQIDSTLWQYSSHFADEFRAFKSAVSRQTIEAQSTPFWAALTDITWSANTQSQAQRKVKSRIDLVISDRQHPVFDLRFQHEIEIPFKNGEQLLTNYDGRDDDLPHSIQISSTERDSVFAHLNRLVSETTSSWFPRTQIAKGFNQGLLVFSSGGFGIWKGAPSIVAESESILIVKKSIHLEVCRLGGLLSWNKSTLRRTVDEDWLMLGPVVLSETDIQRLRLIFPSLDGLREFIAEETIKLTNQVRAPIRTLMLHPRLPGVRRAGAEKVTWRATNNAKEAEQSFNLHAKDGYFHFTEGDLRDLPSDSRIELNAFDAQDRLIDRKYFEATNYSGVTSIKVPKSNSSWLVEGLGGQLERLSPSSRSVDQESFQETPDVALDNYLPIFREDESIREPIRASIEEYPKQYSDLFDILSGVFSSTYSIAPKELFTLVSDLFGGSNEDSWRRLTEIEANYFVQRRYHSNWRGYIYVGSVPKIYRYGDGRGKNLRFVGLLSTFQRLQIVNCVKEFGGSVGVFVSKYSDNCGALDAELPSEESANHVISALQFEIEELPNPAPTVAKWAAILNKPAVDRDTELSPDQIRYFSQKKNQFSKTREKNSLDKTLEALLFKKSQNIYRIKNGSSVWTTRSPNWAMLAYVAIKELPVGFVFPNGSFESSNPRTRLPGMIEFLTLCKGGGLVSRSSAGCLIYHSSTRFRPSDCMSNWIYKPDQETGVSSDSALNRRNFALTFIRRQQNDLKGINHS